MLSNNMDKYIIGGNTSSNRVSLLVITNYDNIDNEQTSITQVNGEKNTNEDYLIFKDTLSINKFYIVAIVFIFLTAVVFCIKRLKK